MATKRLKADPSSIDLILAAVMLSRKKNGFHAGFYALKALGILTENNLPEETGPITATNFRRRMDKICREFKLPKTEADRIYHAWKPLRPYLEKKVSSLMRHRMRRVKLFTEMVSTLFEEYAGIPLESVVSQMTITDLARLEAGLVDDFPIKVAPAEQFSGFSAGDFESIFTLRKRLVELGSLWRKEFSEQTGLSNGPGITAVDYTSGWTALTVMGSPLQVPGEEAGFQIMASPLGLYAGLVLGSNSPKTRKKYYKLLENGSLKEGLAGMAMAGTKLIDIFWFFNIESSLDIDKLTQEKLAAMAREAEENTIYPPFTFTRLSPLKTWSCEEAVGYGENILEGIKQIYRPTAYLVQALANPVMPT